MDDELSFATFLAARIKDRGLNVRKLAEVSGISLKYLECLMESDVRQLPPAPYLRGYIVRLAGILHFDHEVWWERLRKESEVFSSGRSDELPNNRFARVRRRASVLTAALVVLVLFYVAVRLPHIIGKPNVAVTMPEAASVTVYVSDFTLRGTVLNGTTLEVNGEDVPIENGAWEKPVLLDPGLNTFTIRAQKFLGSVKEVTREIFYEPNIAPFPELRILPDATTVPPQTQ